MKPNANVPEDIKPTNVYEMPVSVDEDVAVVPILYLQKKAND